MRTVYNPFPPEYLRMESYEPGRWRAWGPGGNLGFVCRRDGRWYAYPYGSLDAFDTQYPTLRESVVALANYRRAMDRI
jgi:hypothetical protein